MAQDEREEERQFLADLEARTGRDLAAWMAEIGAQGFTDKNETIDWLRGQGIPFARASWLERIHHNGGRPIYADKSAKAGKASPVPPRESPAPTPTGAAPAVGPAPVTPGAAAALEKLIAAAKGYRPLYHMLESELRRALPGLVLTPAKAGYISLAAPREFGALLPTGSELRLGLDLGERAFDAQVQKPRIKGAGGAITHMLVLTDARQINGELMALVMAANTRANGTN
jgi:hypothetical protein